MTAPYDGSAAVGEWGQQTERLRIVQDDRIPGADEVQKFAIGSAGTALVYSPVGVPNGDAVAGFSVEKMVQPLGNAEELLIALDTPSEWRCRPRPDSRVWS